MLITPAVIDNQQYCTIQHSEQDGLLHKRLRHTYDSCSRNTLIWLTNKQNGS